MSKGQRTLIVVSAALILSATAFCSQFVVFPKANGLPSPDGRYEVRSENAHHASTEFTGMFNSLWLVEVATGQSRKLYDYIGVAAVAWSGNDFIAVTEYVGKRTSRIVVFPLAHLDEPVLLNETELVRLVPADLRQTLRDNNHVFVEASRIEAGKLYFRVWGYGARNTNGFGWQCEYTLEDAKTACK